MKAVKRATCQACKYNTDTSDGKADKSGYAWSLMCPRCGQNMKLSTQWYAKGSHEGKKIFKPCGVKKSDAEDFIATCRIAKRKGTVLPGQEQDIKWSEAVENCNGWWDRAVERKKMTAGTREHYKYQIKALERYFEHSTLLTITKSKIESFMDQMGTTHSPATVCHAVKALKRMYVLHMENLDLEQNSRPKLMEKAFIVSKIELPEVNNCKTSSCTPVDVHKVLDLISHSKSSESSKKRLRLAILMGVGMLLRPANINALEWSEIDLENGVISISKDKMKGKRDFETAIPKQILEAIIDWRKSQVFIGQYVFPSPADRNKPIDRMSGAITRWIKAAGLNPDDVNRQDKVTPYVLTRHTGATQLYEDSGENLEMVSKTADHADSRITRKRYVKNRVEYSKRTVIPIQEAMLRKMIGDNQTESPKRSSSAIRPSTYTRYERGTK